MIDIQHRPPRFDVHAAASLAAAHWGIAAKPAPLPSERDQNFRLQAADGARYVLKVSDAAESRSFLECQNAALHRLAAADTRYTFPVPVRSAGGEEIVCVTGDGGVTHLARVLTFVSGRALADTRPHGAALLRDVGALMGTIDRVLAGFEHPAADRVFHWDPRRARDVIARYLPDIRDAAGRARVDHFRPLLEQNGPRLADLRSTVIHADGNDHNVLVTPTAEAELELTRVAGIIDFGDLVRTWTVAELAIACAYAMIDAPDPIATATHVVGGYHAEYPLHEDEPATLFPLICARLCTSAVLSAHQRARYPENAYLSISEAAVHALLDRLARVDPAAVQQAFRSACGFDAGTLAAQVDQPPAAHAGHTTATTAPPALSIDALLARRQAVVGPSLSVAYDAPLVIVRGWRQHLYDAAGRQYLDAVNNVAHVGHSHPRVVEALHRQAGLLNTNTRYLHPLLVDFADRLTATLPPPLRVCWFVCSGSEANELALRMARAHTGQRDVIVLAGAYHGNTSSLIELSPYKFDGPGGAGRAPHVHVAPLPDPYRGPHRGSDAGTRYAAEVGAIADRLTAAGRPPCAFFAEPLPGCGGQIVPPAGFLAEAFRRVRTAGGVCVADEVQTGLGRVGSHFWAFETQDAVPDIVTIGKPMGNGHPLGAVVTTPEIARSFDNGMEYFNTFGGNPVSCTAGLAVLDVIAEEALQANAARVGTRLREGLAALGRQHEPIGDVRGLGLYLGVELVRDRQTRTPAGDLARAVSNRMRERGVLVSTDGPDHNVLKIKPPMVFREDDADRLVATLDAVLTEDVASATR